MKAKQGVIELLNKVLTAGSHRHQSIFCACEDVRELGL